MITNVVLVVFAILFVARFGYWDLMRQARVVRLNKQQDKWCLIVLSICVFYIGASLYCWPIESMRWPSVEGKLVQSQSSRSANDEDYEYLYSVRGETYKHQCQPFFSDSIKKLVGRKVVVHYNPVNPDQSGCVIKAYPVMVAVILFGIILLASGLFDVDENRKGRN